MGFNLDWLGDPTAWLGLGTLVLLEIVLGLDNLIFIAILTTRLPRHQQASARFAGLALALLMRLALLAVVAWVIGLTRPLFSVLGFSFSGRDLILIGGGLFLLLKATTELHDRLEGGDEQGGTAARPSAFWQVVAQIIVLDAVFSLDSIVTAVGMVDELAIMMLAVVIAVAVMAAAARPLTRFVGRHPTVVVLCLSFLLMIGFSLVADGFGLYIPKGYLYAAIGFSVLIEAFNQLALRNRLRRAAGGNLRARAAEGVLRLLGAPAPIDGEDPDEGETAAAFAPQERAMVQGVMTLGERTVRSVMTPRTHVTWLDSATDAQALRATAAASGHSRLPVATGSLAPCDRNRAGARRAARLARAGRDRPGVADATGFGPARIPPACWRPWRHCGARRCPWRWWSTSSAASPACSPRPTSWKRSPANFPMPTKPWRRRRPSRTARCWSMPRSTSTISARFSASDLADAAGRYATLAGFLLARFGRLPRTGEAIEAAGRRFEVETADSHRIVRVRIASPPAESQVQAKA